MADQITTQIDIDAASRELIDSVVQTELIQGSVLAQTVTNLSALVQPGAKSVSIPNMGSFTVEKKQGGQKATKQKLSLTADKILFNEHAVIQGLVEDIADWQSAVPLLAEYLRRMATAHALQLDVDLFAVIKASGSGVAYAAGGAPTKKDFTVGMRELFLKNVPRDNRIYLAISPTQEEVIKGLADFVDADKWLAGSAEMKMNGVFPGGNANGFIGRVYGANVMVTNVVDDGKMHFYHSTHAAFALQKAPRIQSQYLVEYLAQLLSMDQLYGIKALDSGNRAYHIG